MNQVALGRRTNHYAPFDPDRETILADRKADSRERSEAELVRIFESLAEQANYFPIDEAFIKRCFEEVTLIRLRTEVDLDDFERVLCFARGDVFKEVSRRRIFRNRVRQVDVLQRMILFLKYEDDDYFERTGKKRRPEIKPGKI